MTHQQIRQAKLHYLTEVAQVIRHQYHKEFLEPERFWSEGGRSWYRFKRNRDYAMLERNSANPDTALNNIIVDGNFELLRPSFAEPSADGHPFGVTEDDDGKHTYFLLLPKKEELKAGSSGLTPDKVAKKLAKRAKHFLDTLAAEAEAAKQHDDRAFLDEQRRAAAEIEAQRAAQAAAARQAEAEAARAAQAAEARAVQAAAAVVPGAPTPTRITPTVSNATAEISAPSKREREREAEQRALDELRAQEKEARRQRAVAAQAEAEAAAAAEAAAEAAAADEAAAAERAKLAAELEAFEAEQRRRAEQCAFARRAPDAGFEPGAFQTADGNVAAPFVLLW